MADTNREARIERVLRNREEARNLRAQIDAAQKTLAKIKEERAAVEQQADPEAEMTLRQINNAYDAVTEVEQDMKASIEQLSKKALETSKIQKEWLERVFLDNVVKHNMQWQGTPGFVPLSLPKHYQPPVKKDEAKQGEVKQEEIKQEEIKQEEIKQEEIKQEEIKQEEIKQEEIKQED